MNRNAISVSRNGQPAANNDEPSNEVDAKLDRVNELWMKVEKKYLRRQPPRHIAVEVCRSTTSIEGDPYYLERHFLGLQRDHTKWRLCHAQQCTQHLPIDDEPPTDDIPGGLGWKPIVERDLETRIRMSEPEHLDKLKVEIDNTRTFFIPQLDATISRLEDALDD